MFLEASLKYLHVQFQTPFFPRSQLLTYKARARFGIGDARVILAIAKANSCKAHSVCGRVQNARWVTHVPREVGSQRLPHNLQKLYLL